MLTSNLHAYLDAKTLKSRGDSCLLLGQALCKLFVLGINAQKRCCSSLLLEGWVYDPYINDQTVRDLQAVLTGR